VSLYIPFLTHKPNLALSLFIHRVIDKKSNMTGAAKLAMVQELLPFRSTGVLHFQWNFCCPIFNYPCIALSTIACHFGNLALTTALFVLF
jgi:hypothetical protein